MSTLPKIPLDRASDLSFLRLQLHQALSSRLHRHLPNALPEDSLRTAIEHHIAQFLSATMQETSSNVLINGLAPRPSDIAKGVQVEEGEVYEPFDTALQNKVVLMHATMEETIARVTRMRRDVPIKIKSSIPASSSPTEQEEGEEEDLSDEDMNGDDSVQTVSIAREAEVIGNYQRSVRMMKQMKGSVGTVTEKVQRAKEVLTYLQQAQSQAHS